MPGLAYRVLASRGDAGLSAPALPWFLDRPTALLGQAFTPLVLFIAGTSAVGTYGASLSSLSYASLPLGLIVLKSLLMPAVAWALSSLLELEAHAGTPQARTAHAYAASIRAMLCYAMLCYAVPQEREFCFVYGTLPMAGAGLAIARAHRLAAPQMALMETTLALGKPSAFLLLFLSAAIIQIDDIERLTQLVANFSLAMHSLSALATAATVAAAAGLQTWRSHPPLCRIAVLAALQVRSPY